MGEPMGHAFDHMAAAAALLQTERFYQDCFDAFNSLVQAIEAAMVNHPFDWTHKDAQMSIWANGAQAHFYYTFRQTTNDPYRFLELIIRPDTNRTETYQHICNRLRVSPEFPLVLVFGSFNIPLNLDGHFRGHLRIRRTWCRNVFRLEVQDNEVAGGIEGYDFDQVIRYHPAVPGNVLRCQGASFKIKPLAALVNDEAIGQLAIEIAAFPRCD